MNRDSIVKKVRVKLAKSPSVKEMAEHMIHGPQKKKQTFEELQELVDKYDDKWLDAEVVSVKPSKYGKGFDVKVKMKYPGLPSSIETDMIKVELEPEEKIKVKLYIAPGGMLVEEVKQLHPIH